MTRNRPLWRWWLFCLSLDLFFRFRWEWAGQLMGWSVLPEWLGGEEA